MFFKWKDSQNYLDYFFFLTFTLQCHNVLKVYPGSFKGVLTTKDCLSLSNIWMELFPKILNGFQQLTIFAKNSIFLIKPFLMDGIQLCQDYRATTRKQVTCYHRVPRFDWVWLNKPLSFITSVRHRRGALKNVLKKTNFSLAGNTLGGSWEEWQSNPLRVAIGISK